MASVLELFNWRKLRAIHDFISSRQVVSEDVEGDEGEGDERGAEGRGTILK